VTGQPVFFFELGDPECYLVAERITAALGVVAEWEPVRAVELGLIAPPIDPGELEARVETMGLQPLRWPPGWPPDTETVSLAATYAKRTGRGVSFSLAAFRQAFAGGRDLAETDSVLIAAAACEMHPAAVLKGIKLRSIGDALRQANSRAREAGVDALPAIQIDDQLYTGVGALEAAMAGAR
jgi:2-hydroxychromene-2-carboxylate isomerase